MQTPVRELAEELFLPPISREIVGVYIGAGDESAAHKLWESLPPVYRSLRDRIH